MPDSKLAGRIILNFCMTKREYIAFRRLTEYVGRYDTDGRLISRSRIIRAALQLACDNRSHIREKFKGAKANVACETDGPRPG